MAQTNDERPFAYTPLRSFDEVSRSMVGDLVHRLFGGSREQLLVRLMEDRDLTPRERAVLEKILEDGE